MKKIQKYLLVIMIFILVTLGMFSEEIVINNEAEKKVSLESSEKITEVVLESNIKVVTESAIVNQIEPVVLEPEVKPEIKLEKEKYVMDNFEEIEGTSQKGKASFYSKKFQGRETASGEKLSIYEYTAAHKSLKFGTLVKVTNLSNNKSVIVRINDRGPFSKTKIIDLSPLAFKEIASLNKGIINVKIQIVKEKKAVKEKKEELKEKIINETVTEELKTTDLHEK